MKKITIILGLLLVIQTVDVKAQTDTEVVNFTATLVTVLNLNVTGGDNQTVTFDTPDQYNLGVDVVGVTTITIESIDAWDLKINAPDFSDGASATIPINNLGVWCEATGTHLIGTEVSCSNVDLSTSMGITNADQTLLDNTGSNGGNGGDASDNAFNLNWTMGTMQGTMNTASMFDQLSDGTIANVGTFTTIANLTLTALP